MRRRARALAALTLTAVVTMVPAAAWAQASQDREIAVTIPEVADGPFEVSNAQLRWGLNEETGGGAFFGGCNFLSAGISGDSGEARVWTDADVWDGTSTRAPSGDLFASVDGNVRIEKPYRTGDDIEYRTMGFAERCEDAAGNRVGTAPGSSSGAQVVIEGGVGEVDPTTGDATIEWEGAFTVVYYGGLTYWWVRDLTLELVGGAGVIIATGGGYGADMFDLTKWELLPDTPLTLATLSEVSLGSASGFTATPAYLGVEIDMDADGPSGAQVRTGPNWGAFPQSFIDFQVRTGQAGYWYSSGGLVDPKKPTSPLRVNYDADAPGEIPDSGGTGPAPPPLAPPGSGGGPGGAGGGTGGPGPSGGGTGAPPPPGTTTPPTVLDEDDDLPFVLAASGTAGGPLYAARRLIPDEQASSVDPRVTAAAASGGLLTLGAATVVGFRRRWLVLPWTRL